MSNDNKYIKNAKVNLLEMLREDRHFTISDVIEKKFLDNTDSNYKFDLPASQFNKKAHIIFTNVSAIPKSELVKMYTAASKNPEGFTYIILVIFDKVSTTQIENTRIEFNKQNSKHFHAEIWKMEDLQYNISHSEYVPHHELVTNPEEILTKLNVNKKLLPGILKTDPMVRRIGALPSQLIKITTNEETTGIMVKYRVVV